MNVRQLEIFEAIMRTGSVSEGARLLGISQPAVTKSLRLAEQAAGFVLFRHVRGRLYPSPEAESLLPYARRVQREMNTVDEVLRKLRDGRGGSVSVAAPPSLARSFVTPAIAKFLSDRPNILLEALVLPTLLVADHVAQSQVDFGLIHEPIENSRIDDELIGESAAVCIVRNDHPLAERRSVGVRDLEGVPLVCYQSDTVIGGRVRMALSSAQRPRDIDVVVNNSEQAFDLVAAGVGVAIAEPFMLAVYPRPELVSILFRPEIPLRLKFIRARERPKSWISMQLEREVSLQINQLGRPMKSKQ